MRVGVLSDTHLREGRTLPGIVWETLEGVDMILHAGDIVSPGILKDLAVLAPVLAVRGNCDGWDLAGLPEKDIILCGGVRVGLIHGSYGIGKDTPERAYRSFSEGTVDVIVFGHSHSPYSEWREGVLLFNPGSPTDKRREPKYSLGILEIEGVKVAARHIFF